MSKRSFIVKVQSFSDALIFAESHAKARQQVAQSLREAGYAKSLWDGLLMIASCKLANHESIADYTKSRTWR